MRISIHNTVGGLIGQGIADEIGWMAQRKVERSQRDIGEAIDCMGVRGVSAKTDVADEIDIGQHI